MTIEKVSLSKKLNKSVFEEDWFRYFRFNNLEEVYRTSKTLEQDKMFGSPGILWKSATDGYTGWNKGSIGNVFVEDTMKKLLYLDALLGHFVALPKNIFLFQGRESDVMWEIKKPDGEDRILDLYSENNEDYISLGNSSLRGCYNLAKVKKLL